MLTSTSIANITPALIKAQKAMGDATKGSKNPFFKSSYSDLNSVREAVTPALHDNDIAILQPTVYLGGKQFIQTTLLHTSGEWIAGLTEVVTSKVNDPQAAGSGISYSRRYGLMALLSVGAVDDDGEKAMDRPKKEPETKASKAAPALETPVKPAAEVAATPTTPVVKSNGSFKPTKKATQEQSNDGW